MADKAEIERLRGKIAFIEQNCIPDSSGEKRESRRGRAGKDKDLSSAADALGKIVALVNVCDRSELAIRERLARAEFSPTAIDEAITQAKVYGFVDDMRYAAVFIRSRLVQGKGTAGIERDLRMQNIDINLVPGWPDEFEVEEDAEFDRALALLKRRPSRSKNLREGAYRKLISSGFASSVAASAARVWADQLEA